MRRVRGAGLLWAAAALAVACSGETGGAGDADALAGTDPMSDALADAPSDAPPATDVVEAGGGDVATDSPAGADADAAPDAGPKCGNGAVEPGEACDGPAVPCAGLAATWTSGDAPCRTDCLGRDVSACVRAGAPGEFEVVKPAVRDPARWADARCNDGTPFSFRVRTSPTGSRDWVVSLRGGGFCDDVNVPCVRTPDLMSTVAEADGTLLVPDDENGGVMSTSPDVNPALADANLVYAPYCSSDFWSGTGTARVPVLVDPAGWYFAGRINARALLEVLRDRYGLGDDPDVRLLYSGTSAGAFGVVSTADLPAALLPGAAADGRVRLVVDAGWLVADWDDETARLMFAQTGDAQAMQAAWDVWQSGTVPACAAARLAAGGHPADCWFGVHWFPAIASAPPAGLGLPLLVLQSLQDTTFAKFHNHDDVAFAEAYGERQLADALAADPGGASGLKASWFLGRSPYHDVIRDTADWSQGVEGDTIRDVLERFWKGGAYERVIWEPGAL